MNFAQLILIGKTILGYPEEEVWQMTSRKLLDLFKEYKIFWGLEKRDEEAIPGEDVV